MSLPFMLEPTDWILFGVIFVLVGAMARIPHPGVKAFILILPIPFTVASISLGKPVGAANLLGVVLLVGFANVVRWGYETGRVRIIPLIAGAASGYVALSALLVHFLSNTEAEFWCLAMVLFAAALVLVWRQERRHTKPTCDPVAGVQKLLTIAGVVFLLVLLKHHMQGFMTMFPMVGVVAAYEFRDDLWYMCWKVANFALCSIPMIGVIHVLQPQLGLPLALLSGWGVYLASMRLLVKWETLPGETRLQQQ